MYKRQPLLKNILKRFDSVAETTVNYQTVKVLDDFAAAVSWLEGIGETDQLGLYYFSEDDFEGLAACKACLLYTSVWISCPLNSSV